MDDNDNDICSHGCNLLQSKKGKKQNACNCHNLPEIHQMNLLGVKLAMFNNMQGRKKSSGNEEKLENQSEQRYEIIQIDRSKAQKLEVTNEDIRRFVATWKEACQKHSAAEVCTCLRHTLLGAT